MSKIYNEIVIDMNPESSTFEETLYEDSFEYSGGDIIHLYGNHSDSGKMVYVKVGGDQYQRYTVSSDGQWSGVGAPFGYESINSSDHIVESAPSGLSEGANSYSTLTAGSTTKFETDETTAGEAQALKDAEALRQTTISEETAGQTDWGAANITKDMFINADGSQKSIQEVYTTLDPILTGITGEELVNQIKDMFPKYTGVAAEEKEAVEGKYQADIYGLQPGVGGAIKPTTGVGARGDIAAKTGVKKGFEAAGKAREYSIYGLEKAAAGELETGIAGAIGKMDTPFVAAGETGQTSEWGTFDWSRAGGKVPDRGETFLHFLTQLPDAGGT